MCKRDVIRDVLDYTQEQLCEPSELRAGRSASTCFLDNRNVFEVLFRFVDNSGSPCFIILKGDNRLYAYRVSNKQELLFSPIAAYGV